MSLNTNALTTVARVKTFLEISVATYDSILESLINMATDFVERECDRTFVSTAYSNELYDGTGTKRLLLKHFPVSSSATFTLEQRDTDLRDAYWSAIDSNLYHVDYETGIVEFIGRSFVEVPDKYRVSYTAGYAFKNDAAPLVTLESLKIGDLEYAVWKLVAKLFQNRKANTGIQSETIGNYSVTLRASMMADPEVQNILNSYKRPRRF